MNKFDCYQKGPYTIRRVVEDSHGNVSFAGPEVTTPTYFGVYRADHTKLPGGNPPPIWEADFILLHKAVSYVEGRYTDLELKSPQVYNVHFSANKTYTAMASVLAHSKEEAEKLGWAKIKEGGANWEEDSPILEISDTAFVETPASEVKPEPKKTRWQVGLDLERTLRATVYVDAEDEDEAQEKALKESKTMMVEWEIETEGEIGITFTEELEEGEEET